LQKTTALDLNIKIMQRLILIIMNLIIKNSQINGRGVFATQSFMVGDMIETCPVVLLPKSDRALIEKTVLYNYDFSWDKDQGAIAFGYSSLYNHSSTPNATYQKIFDQQLITYHCIRPIQAGEEITVAYHHGTWFTEVNP